MMMRARGFSLVELLIIVILLGLLSVVLLVPLKKLTSSARTSTIQGTNSTIRSAVALSILKYAAAGNPNANKIEASSKAILVNPGSGIPIGAYPGIGTALNFPSSSQSNGLVVDYTHPHAVSFQLSRDANNHCQVIYNGITGITTITTTDC